MKCIKCNSEHDGSYGSGKYCSIKCANSRVFSDQSRQKQKEKNLNQIPWNKGKIIGPYNNERRKNISEGVKKALLKKYELGMK